MTEARRPDLYTHGALLCELCHGREDGWHIVHHGDRAARLWPRRVQPETEPADYMTVECDRCKAHGLVTLRRFDVFLGRWLAGVQDPRVLPVGRRQRGASQDAAPGQMFEAARSQRAAPTSAAVTSSPRASSSRTPARPDATRRASGASARSR